MKPDKYFTIEELVKDWTAWDLTEEVLLKYGSEGTLQFSISKDVLKRTCLNGTSGIQFHCPSFPEVEEQELCLLADNQSIFDLSQDTLSGLKNSPSRKSKIVLLQRCNNCENSSSENLRLLRYTVTCTQYFFDHHYMPVYDLNGIDIGHDSLDDLYCRKEDLLVTREEKERFEKTYLQDEPSIPSIGKEDTLLRAIGALLITFCNRSPYIDSSGEFINSAIATKIGKSLADQDFYEKGISNRKLREIIPVAHEIIRKNKIEKKS